MNDTRNYTAAEHELAQLLLLELLAHQFCSPVQWIKTQDTILGEFATERLVEIGPAETLVNMAKKTLNSGYKAHDVALGLRRELLSHRKNADAIYYATADQDPAPAPSPAAAPTAAAPTPATAPAAAPAQNEAAPSPAPAPAPAPAGPVTVSVPDTPVSPEDVITTIVSVALMKKPSEVPQDQTIKSLCGGRSTVQNEIIGNLTKELGTLPDQPEDISLSDLAHTMAEAGLGAKLGPFSNALVAKVVTSKMPASSSATVLRQYLERRWGFKHGLQDRALLAAIPAQPAARLAGEKEMHAFLDGIAHNVLRGVGIDPASLATAGPQQGSGSASAAPVSSEALKAFEAKQQKIAEELFGVYAKQLGRDVNGGDAESAKAKAAIDELQGKLDAWSAEHGEAYERGIAPAFDAKKARTYDSYWNWSVHQVVTLFSAALVGEPEKFAAQAKPSVEQLSTRACPRLLQVIGFLSRTLKDLPGSDFPGRQVAHEWLMELEKSCKASIANKRPSFKCSVVSKVPVLDVDERGKISVKETPRMVPVTFGGCDVPHTPCEPIEEETASQTDVQSYYGGFSVSLTPPSDTESATATSYLAPTGTAETPLSSAVSDAALLVPAAGQPARTAASSAIASSMWTPRIQTKGRTGWKTNHDITNGYLRWFARCATDGVSFSDKTVLVTGAGKASIGSEIVSLLLSAGAQVLVTTSSYSPATCAYYRDLYHQHGARGSRLVIVPFNGGSTQDVHRLIQYIYSPPSQGGLGWDLDHIVPFAAVGEAGRAIDGIDDRSELAHRVMLTNVIRLLGAVKSVKATRRITTHPTHVLLPLSPNHGIFGQDGLYAESKMALEALLMKWWSEDWSAYLTLCGTVIGWTRGTGLMSNNDVLATGIEADLGIRTFSAAEMAWHVVGLMDSSTASFCDLEPLMADLSGGLSSFVNLKPVLQQIQDKIDMKKEMNKALYKEKLREAELAMADSIAPAVPRKRRAKKAMVQVEKAVLPEYRELELLSSKMRDMVDLERVVVVVGFGEVGPYGSSRTRWEAECAGTFSVTGCLELAWVMGLIKYHNGRLNGKDYCGWIDVKTQAPIADAEVKAKYEDYILEHSGIRLIEKKEHDLTSPDKEQKLHEVVMVDDMGPFEVPLETAEELKRQHGDNAVVTEAASGQCSVILKAGSTIWVPKAAKSRSIIGAQMPKGWDPKTYGIPDDIIGQVDPVTLYALVATVEAFLSAGLTDPYELYEHIHYSEFGNAVGTSLGGMRSLDKMFKRRYLDRSVQNDILAETFVNTTAAWINMLLVGSSGPIRTPVGACATSLESVDAGYDMIVSGKVKAVLVGGTDDLDRDPAHEFANMKATINGTEDAAAGRTPKEASRPATSTRAGFVEGQGCGVQLLTTARLALDMGLPIRGVVALTHMAADGIGRSVPSPGKGMLTIATEKRSGKQFASPLLDMNHRRRQLSLRLRQIQQKRDMELAWLNDRLARQQQDQQPTPEGYAEHCRSEIERDAKRAIREAKNMYGNQFWRHDDSISPLRGALAVWGLTIDDLSVASLHGTSTKQNDLNETAVMQAQLAHLGRTEGNVLPCCLQKGLLGHGKGAAGAFAVNSCLQMLASGLIPGNRNADNIDAELADRNLLFFPSQTYQNPTGIKAFSVTSFGFGQKGAQVIGVNAKYLFATLSQDEYEAYRRKVAKREAAADRKLQEGVYGGKFVTLKDKNVYEKRQLEKALLCRA
ncbi:hypothetical protein VTK26DRAFT_1254 [Humicola hyalothermophila]